MNNGIGGSTYGYGPSWSGHSHRRNTSVLYIAVTLIFVAVGIFLFFLVVAVHRALAEASQKRKREQVWLERESNRARLVGALKKGELNKPLSAVDTRITSKDLKNPQPFCVDGQRYYKAQTLIWRDCGMWVEPVFYGEPGANKVLNAHYGIVN